MCEHPLARSAEHTAATLLREWADADTRAERTEAVAWLEDYLTKGGGEAQRQDIFRAARSAGFSEAAIKRAKDKARITHRSAGFPQQTAWALPVGSPRTVSSDREPTGPTERDLCKHSEPARRSAQSAQLAQSPGSEPTEPTAARRLGRRGFPVTRLENLLSPADRERLAVRLAELRQTERLVTERGQQRPAPEPVPLLRDTTT